MSGDLVERLQALARAKHDDLSVANEAADLIEAQAAEIERLRAEVYVPGQWRCAKCKFTLQQMNLNANTGTVTARDNAGDKCPNCNSPLWRATWKQDAHEMLDRATEQMERVKVAESELSTLRARVREVVGGMLSHSCVADAGPDCKDEEDEAVERAARQLMEDLK